MGGWLGGGCDSEAATRQVLACGLTPVRFAAAEMIRKGGVGRVRARRSCRCLVWSGLQLEADDGHMARRATSRTEGRWVIEEQCSNAADWQPVRRGGGGGAGEGQACVTFNLCHVKRAEHIGVR